MADKRIRTTIPKKEEVQDNKNIITPNEKTPITDDKYDSILEKLNELEEQNKVLTKKVAESNGDISEQVKESKRKYGFNIDGSRKSDEHFMYRYNCLMDNGKEKVILSAETIGRPVHYQNSNTGKWINEHNIKIVFHDKTTTKIDILNYINQKFQYEEYVQDKDIEVRDGKKYFKFHTEKFGDFEIGENFIN